LLLVRNYRNKFFFAEVNLVCVNVWLDFGIVKVLDFNSCNDTEHVVCTLMYSLTIGSDTLSLV